MLDRQSELPPTAVAAIETARRPDASDVASFRVVLDDLSRLLDIKDRAYGGSWKKHGEMFSIIPNIARKVDRLEIVLHAGASTPDEGPLDTVADLAGYAILYLTWLARDGYDVDAIAVYDEIWRHVYAITSVTNQNKAIEYVAQLLTFRFRFDAVYSALLVSPLWCETMWNAAYETLEYVLSYGASTPNSKYKIRVSAAQDMAVAAVQFLAHIRRTSINDYERWAGQWRS